MLESLEALTTFTRDLGFFGRTLRNCIATCASLYILFGFNALGAIA